MSNYLENKCCFVPECKNTSLQAPTKLFITVPINSSRKANWFKAVGRNVPRSKSKFYCCEDHFNLKEDMENYMRYKLMGGRIFLKIDAIPHIFDCKQDETKPAPQRPIVFRRQRKLLPTVNDSKRHSINSAPSRDIGVEKVIKYTTAPFKFRSQIERKREFRIVPGSAASKYTKLRLARESLSWSSVGLKMECMFILDLIKPYAYLSTTSIFLTLQKIRLAQPFGQLGEEYSMSETAASKIFLKSVVLISELMGELIIWPPKDKIQARLPLPFRADYSKVQCIISCFEIKIEKPIDAGTHDLTWSNYKRANTLKYLVSSTPDGVIKFISTAFGGGTSDAVMIKESGFLDRLQPEAVIMADRGFQNIEGLLIQKHCTLLRPPYINQKIETYNNQVINRLQDFQLLNPHPYISSQLIPYMNYITVIACGLINLQ